MNESTLTLIFAAVMLLSLLGNLLQSWWLKQSVPHDLAKEVFRQSRELARKTATPEDDKIVDAGEKFYDSLVNPPYNPAESRD
jgi:hypothetical protein